MKCPRCRTVIPRARALLNAADRQLPVLLAMIADAAGLDAALAIAKECGGQRRYFPPKRLIEHCDQHWLVDLLGREKALLVAGCFFGEECLVPLGPTGGPALKYLKIKDAVGRGLKVDAIARELGVNRRTVQYYLAEIRREGQTP